MLLPTHPQSSYIPIYPEAYTYIGDKFWVDSTLYSQTLLSGAFDSAVVVRLGGKKGNLSGAIQAAVVDWLNKKPRNRLSHDLAVE